MFSSMNALVCIFSVVIGAAKGLKCPEGYGNYYANNCYKFVLDVHITWTAGRQLCAKDGGDLASIHSEEENRVLGNAMPVTFSYFWIGLHENQSGDKYWSDGTPVDYLTLSRDSTSPDVAWRLMPLVDDLKWHSIVDSDHDPVLCKVAGPIPATTLASTTTGIASTTAFSTDRASTTTSSSRSNLTTSAPFPSGGTECGLNFSVDDASDACLFVSEMAKTLIDAERECRTYGAHLVSIHSKSENNFLRRVAISHRLTNGIFIGFQLGDGVDSWLDGTVFDYNNFNFGMPNALFGSCASMDTSVIDARWTSVNCDDRNRFPFICSKPRPCPSNSTYTVSGTLYSPEYPYSTTRGLSCEYFLAASFNTKAQLTFNELHLIEGDAILLYEGLSANSPLAIISSTTIEKQYRTVSGSILRVVHVTATGSGYRQWSAAFTSV